MFLKCENHMSKDSSSPELALVEISSLQQARAQPRGSVEEARPSDQSTEKTLSWTKISCNMILPVSEESRGCYSVQKFVIRPVLDAFVMLSQLPIQSNVHT